MRIIGSIFLPLIVLVAAAQQPNIEPRPKPTSASEPKLEVKNQPAAGEESSQIAQPDYVLGPGDQITVRAAFFLPG